MITELGYGAKVLQRVADSSGSNKGGQVVNLEVLGMSCASCVGKVEKGLRKLGPEVTSASVNLTTSSSVGMMPPAGPPTSCPPQDRS